MKKILILITLSLAILSCTSNIGREEVLPIEVLEKANDNKFTNVNYIYYKDKLYFFNPSTNKYINTHRTSNNEVGLSIVCLIIGALIAAAVAQD